MAAEDYLPISNLERRALQSTRLNTQSQIYQAKTGRDFVEELQKLDEENKRLREENARLKEE